MTPFNCPFPNSSGSGASIIHPCDFLGDIGLLERSQSFLPQILDLIKKEHTLVASLGNRQSLLWLKQWESK